MVAYNAMFKVLQEVMDYSPAGDENNSGMQGCAQIIPYGSGFGGLYLEGGWN